MWTQPLNLQGNLEGQLKSYQDRLNRCSEEVNNHWLAIKELLSEEDTLIQNMKKITEAMEKLTK